MTTPDPSLFDMREEEPPPPQNTDIYIRRMPLLWADEAARLGPRAMRVGNYLWYLAGLNKKPPWRQVKFSLARLERDLGVPAMSGSRGLRDLETAGLARRRRRGRHPSLVTLPAEGEEMSRALARARELREARNLKKRESAEV